MRAPRFYISTALVFWGWQAELLFIAVPLAFVLEFSGMLGSRFDFSADDFNKFVDVSTILLAGAVVVALTHDAEKAIWNIVKWLPAILYPIMAAQQFSTAGRIEIRSFFLSKRKQKKNETRSSKKVDVSWLYALACILPAGTVHTDGGLFFGAVAFFSFWGLWQVRSPRLPVWVWISCAGLILLTAYAGQKQVRFFSYKMRSWVLGRYAGYYAQNPFKSYTAMDEIGRLKLSDKIVLRAVFDQGLPDGSIRLVDGVYNQFINSSWFIRNSFKPVPSIQNDTIWRLSEDSGAMSTAVIYSRPMRRRAVLNLPAGTVKIGALPKTDCLKNQLQVVRIDHAPPLIKVEVQYTGKIKESLPPYVTDLSIPEKERAVVSDLAGKMNLNGIPERQVISEVRRFFLSNFKYSLELQGRGNHETALQNFLLKTRAGHCELFATATVLLLRKAGIPARYVTGFFVHEYSDLEEAWVARQRDAHAWVRAYVGGQWIDVDTTPSDFLRFDAAAVSPSGMKDMFSYVFFQLSKIRHETGKQWIDQYGLWLSVPLIIILVFRLRRGNGVRRVKKKNKSDHNGAEKQQTAYQRLEAYLAENGLPRYPSETYLAWVKRIQNGFAVPDVAVKMIHLLDIHNRMRFSKNGISRKEEQYLERKIGEIISTRPETK